VLKSLVAETGQLPSLLDEYLMRKEAAAALGICPMTLDRWRRAGKGPPITKLGRQVLYSKTSIRAWLTQHEAP
jgi:predicted DNA-binding transcriptional regulator AlpA